MIKRIININDYWKVIVYYNVNYNLFSYIVKDLHNIHINDKTIERVYTKMSTRKAKAVTISNVSFYTSVVLFNTHKTKLDYINSIVHEAEHIKQDMLMKYDVKDEGEEPAYTIGYLVMKMIEVFNIL